MSRSGGQFGRPKRREAQPAAAADETAAPPAPAPKVQELLDSLARLSTKKQVAVFEEWSGAELELENGLVVTARSKKEHRRFTRGADDEMLRWLGGLREGDVLFDIGANCGSLTLAAGAMHGAGVRIVAIEPGYANFESMVRNLSRNGMLEFVVPLQAALMERTSLEPINYNVGTAAGLSLHAVGEPVNHLGERFEAVETQMVLAFALDDLLDLRGMPAPTHVKIDVDGVEGPLLRGASRTLAKGVIRELVVEIVDHDGSGARLASITAHLQGHGYELAETFRHHADDRDSFVADYRFLTRAQPR